MLLVALILVPNLYRFVSDNLSLKRVRSCEDVRALSAICCKTAPSAGAFGDFTELPIEVIHIILDYLPSNCFKFIRNNTIYIVSYKYIRPISLV